MFGAQYFGQEDFGGVALYDGEVETPEVTVGPPVSVWVVSGALATFYCAQIPLAGAQYLVQARQTGGGGWSHRGRVTLPPKKKDALGGLPSLPRLGKLPKPPYRF